MLLFRGSGRSARVSFERSMIIRNGFNLLPIFAKKALSYTFDKDPE